MSQVLAELGITSIPHIVLMGDGSGNASDRPNGWACALIDTTTGERKAFYGGLSHGSINMAELMPYLQALQNYHDVGRGKMLLQQFGVLRVVIITDSTYVAFNGAKAANLDVPLPDTHKALWASVRQLCRDGYVLSFHHRERSTTALNQWADLVASESRKAVIAAIRDNIHTIEETLVSRVPLSGLNPS